LPGRFSVLLGANSAGKSTIVDSIVMSHRDVFPGTARPSAAVLSKSVPTRTIDDDVVHVDGPSGSVAVGVALRIGVEGHPLLVADQVLDEPLELGRVLDTVLGLADTTPNMSSPRPSRFRMAILMRFERLALQAEQRRPVDTLGYDPVEAELVLLLGHLRNSR
jgi:hypothetical protein